MAFTGAPVVTLVNQNTVRITGVSLAASAVGTIGVFGSGLNIELPAGFQPHAEGSITLLDSVQVQWNGVAAWLAFQNVRAVKTAGPPFTITMTNGDAVNATPALEIYIEFST